MWKYYNDNFKYSHFSSPHQLLPFQLRESMLSFFPCRFSAAVVLQHSAASSSASSLLRITASAVDTVAAFFSSENIFPVLGEYSTNVEYSISLVVLNRTRLLKHGDTFGTIVSNIIDKYGNQIISIKPSGYQQISTEPS